MKRFAMLDDDGFSVGTISARSLADAKRASNGRQVKEIKTARKPTLLERYRAGMAAVGPAPY